MTTLPQIDTPYMLEFLTGLLNTPSPTGFTEEVPYTIAVVDYGDYKVFGRIDASVPEDELAVGMKMKTVTARTPNDRLTYVFVKA